MDGDLTTGDHHELDPLNAPVSQGLVAQPRRTGDDAIQRDAAPGIGLQDRRAHDTEPGRENDLSALSTSLDGHAPSAVGRGHQLDWLGHESPTTTHQYVEADLTIKEKALARLQDPNVAPRRFRADDDLLKFLKTL